MQGVPVAHFFWATCHGSRATTTLAGRDPASDQVSHAERLWDVPVEGRRRHDATGLFERQASALNPEAGPCDAEPRSALLRASRRPNLFKLASGLDELPLSFRARDARSCVRDVAEQRSLHCWHIRWPSYHDEHGDRERPRQAVNVDDVESADRDALHQDRLDVLAELTLPDELHHLSGRVRAVPPDPAAHDPVDARSRADDANQEDVASVITREGPIIEANYVHGFARIAQTWPGRTPLRRVSA